MKVHRQTEHTRFYHALFVLLALVIAIPPMTYAPKNTYIVLQIFHKNNYIALGVAALMLLISVYSLWHFFTHRSNGAIKKTSNKKGRAVVSSSAPPFSRTFPLSSHIMGPVAITWLAVIAWGTASYAWSDNSGHYLAKAFFWWGAFITFFCTSHLLGRSFYRNGILYALLLTAAVIGFYGILQYTFDFDEIIAQENPSSTFGNRNVSNHLLVLISPIALYLMVADKHRGLWHFGLISFALMLIYTFVFISTSRGPWGAVFISTVTFIIGSALLRRRTLNTHALWNNINKRTLIVLGLMIVLGLTLSSLKYNEADEEIQPFNPFSMVLSNVAESVSSSAGSSMALRLSTWNEVAKPIIKDKPIVGHGLGNYHYIAEKYITHNTLGMFNLHNDFLELTTELGLIGAALITLALLTTLWCLFKLLLNRSVEARDKLLVISLLGVMLGTCFNAMFSFPYQHAAPTITLGVLLAFINFIHLKYAMKSNASASGQPTQSINQHSVLSAKTLRSLGLYVLMIPAAGLMASITFHWMNINETFESQLSESRWKNIDYKAYSYNRYVRSMLRTTMRSYDKRDLNTPRIKAATNFLTLFPHSHGLSFWAGNVANANALKMQRNGASSVKVNNEFEVAASLLGMATEFAPKGSTAQLKKLSEVYTYRLKAPHKMKPYLDNLYKRHTDEQLAKNKTAHLDIGNAYILIKDSKNALEHFNKGLTLFPKDGRYTQGVKRAGVVVN